MENDPVKLDEANYLVIKENCSRIERIFNVHIEILHNHGEYWICNLSPETSSTQENLVKAKIYIQSLLGVINGFSSSVVNNDVGLTRMILKNRDDIERESAAVIVPGECDSEIKIHGPLDNVIFAKSFIGNLMRQQAVVFNNDGDVNNDSPYLSHSDSNHKAENNYLTQKSVKGLTKKTLCKSKSDYVYSRRRNIDGSLAKDVGYHGNETPHAMCQNSSSESSDNDDGILEILNDPDYQSKIEFALKLGYNETDLCHALTKLGVDSSQNELLTELIKQGSYSGYAEPGDECLFTEDHPVMKEDVTEVIGESGRKKKDPSDNLRHIIIDGSNIAMSHGNKETFSCHGIKLAVEWFKERGHKDITVFVPQWRKETSRSDSRMKDQAILNQLEKEKFLVYTPARRIGGKRVVCYDDRYILKLAVDTDGIVVSNDNYRDLLDEKEDFKKVIEQRLLMYSFVNDRFMPPDDPLGRNGPDLEEFLQKESLHPKTLPPLCPYGSKKCTYGNKCKFYHPERRNITQKSVTEKLAEQSKLRMMEFKEKSAQDMKKPSLGRTKSLNPGEIGKCLEDFQFTSNKSESINSVDKKDEETCHLFNKKLSESLRKMEKEKDVKEPMQKTPDKKGNKKRSKDNVSSPRWNILPGGISLGGVSPGGSSSRGTSPVSNLIVPGQDQGYDEGEKFLCGHLLLAKKLSDEANESSKNKKAADKQMKESPLAAPAKGSNLSYHFSEISPGEDQNKPKRLPVQKQTLSRQYSLQGVEDPRLHHGHSPLRQQLSYGGRTQQLQNNMPNTADVNSMMRDFMQGQSQNNAGQTMFVAERSNSLPKPVEMQHGKKTPLARKASEGFTPSFSHEYHQMCTMNSPSHTPLTRMQSAPDQFILQHQQLQSTPKMTRQNSSSDTQLNKLDMDSMAIPYLSGQPVHNHNDGNMCSSGSVIGDAGPVSFHFLGQPQPHGRTMGNTNQAIQSNAPKDLNYQYQQNQITSQQNYKGQQQALPYRNMYTSGVSYGVSPPTVMGPVYSGIRLNQSSAGLGSTGIHAGQQVPMGISEYGLPGVQHYPPGPPHFLDEQTSQIWGNGQFLPIGSMSGFQGNSQCDRASPMHMSPVISQQSNRLSPVPNVNESFPNDPKRYELYNNLCKLFPEEQVRMVMMLHPEADNPNDICAYLIGAK